MQSRYIIDASILIRAFSKNDTTALKTIEEIRTQGILIIPSIVFVELRIGLTEKQAQIFLPTLEELGEVISINYDHALKAGELLRKYKDNGISFTDGILAAIAIIENAELVSFDRDFKVIKELSLYKLI